MPPERLYHLDTECYRVRAFERVEGPKDGERGIALAFDDIEHELFISADNARRLVVGLLVALASIDKADVRDTT